MKQKKQDIIDVIRDCEPVEAPKGLKDICAVCWFYLNCNKVTQAACKIHCGETKVFQLKQLPI